MGRTGKKSDLTDKQRRAINALLSEPTIKQAAKAAKIGESTLFRWLNSSQFTTALKEARGRVLESTLTGLQGAAVKAVETLYDVMTNEQVFAAVRVTAARTILEMSLRTRELIEDEDRLRAIETQLRKEGRL